jgi:RNA polymerase sigma-70 factor (ECF subfamily)
MALSTAISDERALLAAAQAGDERAFRRLIEPYRAAIEVHCYRMLASPHDAEDILQETLLRAWGSLGRFQRRAAINTWLYRIATNACLDELERRPRRPEPAALPYPDDRLDEPAEPVSDPAARYALREGIELAFVAAIQQLPGRQRAVLLLRDVLGWSSAEVADLLESTVAAVNSALQRARATIDRESPPAALPVVDKEADRELLRRYIDAWERVDMDALVALLREDAVMRMPPGPAVHGAAEIADFLRFGCPLGGLSRYTLTPTRANGRPAVVIHRRAEEQPLPPHGVTVLETDGYRITGFDTFIEPALVAVFERR